VLAERSVEDPNTLTVNLFPILFLILGDDDGGRGEVELAY